MPDSAAEKTPEAVAPGARKAAAVLLALGPEIAGTIMRQLSEGEIRRLAAGARALRGSPPDEFAFALREFTQVMEHPAGDVLAGDALLRDFAAQAVGEDTARRAFDPAPPPSDDPLAPLAEADPESLAIALAREHPQTAAVVLSALDPERAAAVMRFLPEDRSGPIVLRMARVEAVVPDLLRQVGRALARELRSAGAATVHRVDGRTSAIEVLRRLPAERQQEMLADIERADATLAGELRQHLFTIEDLVFLSDRDVQTVIREIDIGRLALVLKGATESVRGKIVRNMSTRAAQFLEEEMAGMGPVRVSAVEEAQRDLARTVRQLADDGRVTLVGPGDRMV